MEENMRTLFIFTLSLFSLGLSHFSYARVITDKIECKINFTNLDGYQVAETKFNSISPRVLSNYIFPVPVETTITAGNVSGKLEVEEGKRSGSLYLNYHHALFLDEVSENPIKATQNICFNFNTCDLDESDGDDPFEFPSNCFLNACLWNGNPGAWKEVPISPEGFPTLDLSDYNNGFEKEVSTGIFRTKCELKETRVIE